MKNEELVKYLDGDFITTPGLKRKSGAKVTLLAVLCALATTSFASPTNEDSRNSLKASGSHSFPNAPCRHSPSDPEIPWSHSEPLSSTRNISGNTRIDLAWSVFNETSRPAESEKNNCGLLTLGSQLTDPDPVEFGKHFSPYSAHGTVFPLKN